MNIDSKLVKYYEDLIQEHSDIAEKYRLSLQSLLENFGVIDTRKNVPFPEKEKVLRKPIHKKSTINKIPTFKDNVVELLLKEKRPLSASELRALYNERYNKSFGKEDFSPRLSTAIGTTVKKHVVAENPQETRNFYGLPEWFNGDELKVSYLEKIKAGQTQLLV